MENKLKLTFYGGAGTVTGANFMLEPLNGGVKILIDCGMLQGSKFAADENRSAFSYDPASVSYLLVTHAHIDHIGRIPKLVHDGFNGKILSTPATRMIFKPMLEDALRIHEEESRHEGVLPFYNEQDIEKALSLWSDIHYHENTVLDGGFSVYAKDAGHILGSAMFEITQTADKHGLNTLINADKEYRKNIKVVFTGDLGNSPSPILPDTEKITDADYLVMESVYGDRNHEDAEEKRERLCQIIKQAIERNGTLLIPSFSLEKTQVLLNEINFLIEGGKLPKVPVYLDSPLAIKITEIYKQMSHDFNEKAKASIASGDDIFNFPRLKFTAEHRESEAIAKMPAPKIIIAGAGMSTGGRIIHHEKKYLPDPKNTILFVGYQSAGSLGRMIQEGEKKVEIEGQQIEVRAEVETISGYSSHKDSDHLIEFVADTAESLKKVFVVMGEPKASLFLAQRLRDYIGVNAVVPGSGISIVLD